MKKLITDILEIIKDYQKENLYPPTINSDHISNWINQFEEKDREFILTELLHILPKSYLSKENTLRILSNEFETFARDYGYNSVKDFFDETIFLDCQQEEKSQKVFLNFVKDILKNNFNYNFEDCGKKGIKNWIYQDDVLASGGTFKRDINKEIQNFGKDEFNKSGINIIASFVILHTWAVKNITYSLDQSLGIKLKDRLKFYRVAEIDNYPRINFYNSKPKFNNVYPIKSQIGDKYIEFLQKLPRDYELRNEDFLYRKPNYPIQETFYTNAENRNRYEQILLEKGCEIIYSIANLGATSLRPLGMTPPSYCSLGTGSHFFTWRNISNTCPIVFWWEANGWYPLFPVKNRG